MLISSRGLVIILAVAICCVEKTLASNERAKRGIIQSLLGINSKCTHEGLVFDCTTTWRCWSSGGINIGSCSINRLYTCCAPPKMGNRANVPIRAQLRQSTPFASLPPFIPTNGIGYLPIYNSIRKAAHFAEFPWLVHLRISDYQCGGVLVSEYHVATAAHCIFRANMEDIEVHLGEYDVKDTGYFYEPLPSQVRGVIEKTIHPNFQFMTLQPDRYDLAILHLSYPVQYRSNVAPICLPPLGASYNGFFGVVAGWGKTDNSLGRTGTHLLQKVEVPILSNEACIVWHQQKNIRLELHEEMMCAGFAEGRKDACLGDSGGPLVVKDGDRWYLAGIISAGFGCGLYLQPGIYHRVAVTSGWISAVINNQIYSYDVF